MPCAADRGQGLTHFYHIGVSPETRVQIHDQVGTMFLVNLCKLLLRNWSTNYSDGGAQLCKYRRQLVRGFGPFLPFFLWE